MTTLSTLNLALAALLVIVLAAFSWFAQWGVQRSLLIATVRTIVQLSCIGFLLTLLFNDLAAIWLIPIVALMILLAGREVMVRQKYRLAGNLGAYFIGLAAMSLSSITITLYGLLVAVQHDPWYEPQYAIPLLGMVLGNTMTGISLAMDRLNQMVLDHHAQIEQQLMLAYAPAQAIRQFRNEAARAGMIPIINAMSAAGIISLPGMMTGQILSGTPPIEAVKYQLLIMFMIVGATGIGILLALHLSVGRYFDDRQRLLLDRIHIKGR